MEGALLRYPYYIRPQKGVWECVVSGNKGSFTFSNCTVPEVYQEHVITTWNSIPMNLALCNWQTTFSDPFYTGIPSHIDLINFLFGPSRIPMW